MAATEPIRIGPYEIVDSLGSGGMGEVYRAHDTRLGRDVALKLISKPLSTDPRFHKRFVREARAISALNHPHICALYDVGLDAGREFLVMELIEGESLATRLAAGPLDPREALRYGIQIVSALEAAHRKGIVHRDLKPANIMITSSGVKLLDFGLARIPEVAGEQLTAPTTAEGIVGTVDYMAPEQLSSGEIDERTDIFSFAVVLHEMLTGIRPFTGHNQASVIGAILFAEAPSVLDRVPVSPNLDRLLKVCLEKKPEDRIQTAHDLRLQLEWLAEGASGEMPRPRRRMRLPVRWIAALVTAVLAIALAVGGYHIARSTGRAGGGTVVRFSLVAPVANEELTWAAVSPDGRQIALVTEAAHGGRSLWVRPVDSVGARKIDVASDVQQPFWSPDSASLGFFANDRLNTIHLRSGRVVTLAETPAPRGGTWGAEDTILYTPHIGSGLLAIPASGGKPVEVTTLDRRSSDGTHRWPEFLPDGRRFVFVIGSPDASRAGLHLGSLDGDESKRLGPQTNRAVVTAASDLLFVSQGSLYRQPFDPDDARLEGEPALVARKVTVDPKLTGGSIVSVSRTGVLLHAYVPPADSRFVWVDRAGRELDVVPAPPAQYHGSGLSPDERYLLTSRTHPETGRSSAILIEVGSGRTSRVTVDEKDSEAGLVSRDGSTIYFGSNRSGNWAIYERPLATPGPVRLVYESGPFAAMIGDTPRGLLIEEQSGAIFRYFLLHEGRRTLIPMVPDGISGAVSGDGEWLAYNSSRLGEDAPALVVQSLRLPDVKYELGVGGWDVKFSHDGSELFYVDPQRRLTSIAFSPPDIGTPRPLFTLRARNVGHSNGNYLPSRDGRRFLTIERVTAAERANATVVVNWR
ncbi:MAG TPA: protein kinase [Thermoanaerobaculia bacterium]